jgi:hypothetical protein
MRYGNAPMLEALSLALAQKKYFGVPHLLLSKKE